VALINIINVFLALLKDILMASYFGTSKAGDAFFLGFLLPDVLWNNIFSVSVAVASIPVFVDLLAKGQEREWRQLKRDLYLLLITFSVMLMMFLFWLIGAVTGNQGGGEGEELLTMALSLLKILLPLLLLYPVIVMSSAELQAKGRYGLSVVGALLLNGLWIIGLLFLSSHKTDPSGDAYQLGAVIVGATFLELIFLRTLVGRQERLSVALDHQAVKDGLLRIWSGFWPYFLMLTLLQLIQFYERYLGSVLPTGSISAISYAARLSQLPTFLFSYSVAVVVLPELSRQLSMGQLEDSGRTYFKAVKGLFAASVPVAIGLIVLREPIIRILLERNAFDGRSVDMTSTVLWGYGFAVIFQVVTLLNIRIAVAVRKLKAPLLILIGAVLINILADWYLTRTLGIAGIGMGAAIGAICGGLPLLMYLTGIFGGSLKRGWEFSWKVLAANIPVLIIALLALWIWENAASTGSELLQLGYGILVGFSVLGAAWFSVTEMKIEL